MTVTIDKIGNVFMRRAGKNPPSTPMITPLSLRAVTSSSSGTDSCVMAREW